MSPADVVLVTTGGEGSMDRYGRQLGARLGVPVHQVPLKRTSAGHFAVPALSRASLRGARGDVAVVRELRAQPGVPHFAHHHFARYGPALRRPYLVTAHDLIRFTDLGGGPARISRPTRRDRLYLRADAAGVRGAAAVLAVSGHTRDDLVRRLELPPSRVHVVHEGLDHDLFRPVPRRLVDGRYLLFVGSEHPRKNLPTLLRAFARVVADPRCADVRLVKVGSPGDEEAPFHEPTRRALDELRLGDRVLFTGEVPDDDLPAYYSHAECLVLPSRAEGFGFPPLEAMACGAPVVVSTAGALPEVAGGAALLVEPDDVDGLAAALCRVLDDPSLRGRLREAGLRRAAEFTWDRTAAETRRVYEAALG